MSHLVGKPLTPGTAHTEADRSSIAGGFQQLLCGLSSEWARDCFGRAEEFEAETKLPGFGLALANSAQRLYQWSTNRREFGAVPSVLFDTTGEGAEFPSACLTAYLHYTLARAVHLAAIRDDVGGLDDRWRTSFEWLRCVAVEIGDQDFIRLTAPRRKDPRTDCQSYGHVKYLMFLHWMSGGLWTLSSIDEQLARLHSAGFHMPHLTYESLRKSRTRLGLVWPFKNGEPSPARRRLQR